MEEMESAEDTDIKGENFNNNQQSIKFNQSGTSFPKIKNEDLAALFGNNEENLRYYLGLAEALRESRSRGEQCWCDPQDIKMKTRIEQSQWRPKVVIRLLDDLSSSEEGTYGFSSKQTALDEKEESDETDDDSRRQMEDIAGNEVNGKSNGAGDSFSCGVQGCTQIFSSLASYESHYHTAHNFVCAMCKRKFVSNFLLDIHLQENHDSYFSILCSRIDMYRCLVESCDEKFRTPELRKDHLVTQHKYPASFSFHKPIKPNRSKKSKGTREATSASPNYMEDNSMDSNAESSSASSSSVSQTSPLSPPSSAASSGGAMEVEIGDQHKTPVSEQHGAAGKKNKGNRGGRGRGKKVPPVICFGRGSQRAFQHRGRGGGRGRHWHQMGAMDADTSVDIEKVEFGDMMESLGECT